VVLSERLVGSTPTSVTLHGVPLALFRTAAGRVGAMVDVCPHRRMRLSRGRVRGDRLVCPYHGWSFGSDGAAECHGVSRPGASAIALEVAERHGAVWVRRAGGMTPAPDLPTGPDAETFKAVGVLQHTVHAPMPLVLDNFVEVEHTGTTHAVLGYDTTRLGEVRTTVETRDDAVRVINEGPQKPMHALLRQVLRVQRDDVFVDDWTTYFSPVFGVYDHGWRAQDTGERRPFLLRTAVFFNPVDDARTELFSFLFVNARMPRWASVAALAIFRPVILRLADLEVRLDKAMLESLASQDPSLDGLKLGRFDKALVACRKRLDAVYNASC
jgi:vanillate O-demethylase monooxygenase subunit